MSERQIGVSSSMVASSALKLDTSMSNSIQSAVSQVRLGLNFYYTCRRYPWGASLKSRGQNGRVSMKGG